MLDPKQFNNKKKHLLHGFTLLKLLIVVVILAALAGVVIPQLSGSQDDAKLAVLDTNLASLRKAIDLYTIQHGHFPGAVKSGGTCAVGTNTDTATPGAAAFVAHLTQYTTVEGVACSQKDGDSGGLIRYGPYFGNITLPSNPMTGLNTVTAIQTGALQMTGSGSDNDGGWLYDFITGQIIADQPSYDDR